MSLIFLDSFDHYSSSQNSRKWTIASSNAHPSGRTNNGLTVNGASGVTKTFDAEYATVTVGAAYKTTNFSNPIFSISNTGRSNTPSVSISHVGDGRLYINSGTLGGTILGTFVMNTLEWYYMELQAAVEVNGTTTNPQTTYQVRVNNEIIGTGVTTHTGVYSGTGAGNLNYANVSLSGPGGGHSATYDDLYVTDTEFLGDIRIYVIRPNGDHATTDWTQGGISTGTDDYNFINDTNPDDDTSYLLSTASGQTEFTEMEDIAAFTGSVAAAQALWCMKKSDAGAGIFQGLLLDGTGTGGTSTASIWYPSYASYLYFHKGYTTSPFTGIAWTTGEINAIKQGEKRTG